jgi:hypothetical protein
VDSTGTCSTGSSILTLGGHAYRLCDQASVWCSTPSRFESTVQTVEHGRTTSRVRIVCAIGPTFCFANIHDGIANLNSCSIDVV